MDELNNISSSGPVATQHIHVSDCFTDYKELPSNGYSRLFCAQRYGQWHVLKGLKPEYANDPQYTAMLSKEFTLTVELNHPNIVRALSQEQDPVVGDCIVLEFVDGRPLDEFLREKPDETARRQVLEELLSAMSYFHRKQVVHQDLKPSNILITHDGNHVKVIDFGFADSRAFSILKEPAYTQSYAAPEQLADGEIDNRTDLYAFGLILKELFPSRYGRVVRKCLQPQKEKRFPSAEAILREIHKVDRNRKGLPLVVITTVVLVGMAGILIHPFSHKNNGIVNSSELERPMGDTSRLTGALNGLFSVSTTKQVRFSRGNLQYNTIGKHRTADGGTAPGTWRFAQKQYEILGDENEHVSASNTGWIDLFGWGTSGWNSGAACYLPWSSSLANNDYYPGGISEGQLTGSFAFADWGVYNAINNGGNTPNRWRVLTMEEYEFLCLTRKASTIGRTANARFVKAIVNGVKGLILFPDEYTHPKTLPVPVNINIGDADWEENQYSTDDWNLMEETGAVFLPAAGVRFGLDLDDQQSGYYWSSTCASNSQAYCLCLGNKEVRPDFAGWRLYGVSIRLVQDVN